MKQHIMALILLITGTLYGDPLPEWFIPLRDAVYEQQLKAGEIAGLYQEAARQAERLLSGYTQYIMFARCEYMMGRAYQYENRKEEAAARFEQGIAWAEQALEIHSGAEGWQMLAENISQSCTVRPFSYSLTNGFKVERYAKKALELDSRNAAAQYMLAARYVYAPSPFNNYDRGIRMMEDIIRENKERLQRDDRFNVYSSIGYAYYQQKKYKEARFWLEKSLTVYPTNKFVRGLLAEGIRE